jgi:hypothetical protein
MTPDGANSSQLVTTLHHGDISPVFTVTREKAYERTTPCLQN